MRILFLVAALVLSVMYNEAASAAETISYTYDAKGRLVKVVHSGSINNGVVVDYTYEDADNRTNVKTSGSNN